jgi:hypothetical protein
MAPVRLRLGPPRSTVLRASRCYRVHPRDQDLVAGVVIASRLVRVNAVTVNDVPDGHNLLEIDCVDRVYLSLSVPSLVVGGQMVNFPTVHEHNPIPTPRCWSGGSGVPRGARPHRLPAGRKTTPQPRQREKIATAASEGIKLRPNYHLKAPTAPPTPPSGSRGCLQSRGRHGTSRMHRVGSLLRLCTPAELSRSQPYAATAGPPGADCISCGAR